MRVKLTPPTSRQTSASICRVGPRDQQ